MRDFVRRDSTTGSRRVHLRPHQPLDLSDLVADHVSVEEEQGREGLSLGRCAYVLVDSEMREELVDLGFDHFGGVPVVVEPNVAHDPVAVGSLGPRAVVTHPKRLPHLIHEFRCTWRCGISGSRLAHSRSLLCGNAAPSGFAPSFADVSRSVPRDSDARRSGDCRTAVAAGCATRPPVSRGPRVSSLRACAVGSERPGDQPTARS